MLELMLGSETSHLFEQVLQLVMLVLLDQNMLVVDVFNNDAVIALLVDPGDNSLDRGITLHEDAFIKSQHRALIEARECSD